MYARILLKLLACAALCALLANHAPAGEAPTKPAAASAPAVPRIAYLRLCDEILEGPPDFSLFAGIQPQSTLADWLQRLAKARNDAGVDAVALEIDSPLLSWAQAQELADAVRRLDAVKPVYAYFAAGGVEEYLVASAARNVAMDPAGDLEIVGLAAELMFFKGTLDLLGIQPQMIQVGRFKGAAEPMTATEPSPEQLAEYNKVLDCLYDQLCGQIARQRRLKPGDVKSAIDEGPLSAQEAIKLKLVDGLLERLAWEEQMLATLYPDADDCVWLDDYGAKPRKSLDLSSPLALLNILVNAAKSDGEEIHNPTIAVIHAEGLIVPGESGQGLLGQKLAGSDTLVDCLGRAADDERVKAVILRIDSPGGSALASELIYQAVVDCASCKPVVASISGTGASGGYYIALGADTIVADGASIVGSVGVLSGKLAMTGLMEKVGIKTFELTRGANAGLNLSRPWTANEQAVVEKLALRTYDLFVQRVKDSRGDRIKDVRDVTEGRVFTAQQAAANGLIDKVGGLRDAVLAAQEAADLREATHFLHLPRPRTLADLIAEIGGASTPNFLAGEGLLRRAVGRGGASYLLNLAALLGRETTLAAMPYYLSIRR